MTDQLLPFAEPLHPQPVQTAPQTPFQRELIRRRGNYVRLLRRLQDGPATNRELAEIAGHRFGGRLTEMRADGGRIDATDLGGGLFSYALVTLPDAILVDEDSK